MRAPIPLGLESAALRVAGKLSRVTGRGGGTTLPGKLLWKLDPGAIDLLDRYGELEIVAARWREAVAELPDAQLVLNGDDPQVGDLARVHGGARLFGLDDPRRARPALQHAADSKYCLRCGTPYDYAAAYVGHLGDYTCPNCGHARPALVVDARGIELHVLDRASI